MIRLICLKELILVKPMSYAGALFVITGTFLRSILKFSQKYAIIAMI